MYFLKLIVLVSSLLGAVHTRGESLKLVVTDTRLPQLMYSPKAVYDGMDSIYIFGAWTKMLLSTLYSPAAWR